MGKPITGMSTKTKIYSSSSSKEYVYIRRYKGKNCYQGVAGTFTDFPGMQTLSMPLLAGGHGHK